MACLPCLQELEERRIEKWQVESGVAGGTLNSHHLESQGYVDFSWRGRHNRSSQDWTFLQVCHSKGMATRRENLTTGQFWDRPPRWELSGERRGQTMQEWISYIREPCGPKAPSERVFHKVHMWVPQRSHHLSFATQTAMKEKQWPLLHQSLVHWKREWPWAGRGEGGSGAQSHHTGLGVHVQFSVVAKF